MLVGEDVMDYGSESWAVKVDDIQKMKGTDTQRTKLTRTIKQRDKRKMSNLGVG